MIVFIQISTAIKEVLKRKLYLLGFSILAPMVFFLFVLIPVFSIPGNDIAFQLSIFTLRDYTVLSALSIVSSLFFVMQTYTFFSSRETKAKLRTAGQGAVGGYGGLVAALFGTASCTSCLVSVFGFLGFGTILFLSKYQWLILMGAIVLMLISIYFTSKKIIGVCTSCEPDNL